MRTGNERDSNARRAAAVRAEEWEPLLEILRTADSAVGAAAHWVESHGGHGGLASATCYPGGAGGGKRRKGRELWRFVPELLASEVVYVEEEEEEEEAAAGRRTGARVGNCIWMQTLPAAMQTNILMFLNVEHGRFRAKDLEFLAQRILSSPVEPEFWLLRAATMLLNTSMDQLGLRLPSSKDKCTFVGMEEYNALPDWLGKYTEQQNGSGSSLPLKKTSCGKDVKQLLADDFPTQQQEPLQCQQENSHLGGQLGESGFSVAVRGNIQDTHYGTKDVHVASPTPELVKERSSVKSDNAETRGNLSDGVKSTLQGNEVKDDGQGSFLFQEDMTARHDLGDEVFSQALTLRQALRSRQANGLPEEIGLLRSTPKLPILLSVVRAWEVDDEVTLLLVGNLLTEQDGYAWSTQIVESIFLQKLLDIEKPASRILITALAQAGKTHPRATMDAVVFPLICSDMGASNIQCDVLNRMVKDCLPEEVNLTLCEKMFAAWEAKLHSSKTKDSWVWTEGMVTVVQNILNHRLNLDQRTIAGLVCALDGAVTEYSTSLKFGNLLLNLFTKYGPKLKAHKAMLQMVVIRSKTFLTKSLLTKLAAI